MAKNKLTWWNVTMAWLQEDEGTYTESFLAETKEDAKLMCAKEMVESLGANGHDFGGKKGKEKTIQALMKGYSDAYEASAQFRQDLNKLFGDVLFPDGCEREVDLEKLGELLAANRDAIVVQPVERQRQQG